jgi:mannosyltransferase OCH1-like enzyme
MGYSMIPQKIHYCWLSGESMPISIQKCMTTWKTVMPEYEFVLWDQNRFDINSIAFISEACKYKLWAFAADYIRAYALYNEGGIYLDTDVIVKKSFNDFMNYGFFSAIDCHYGIKTMRYERKLKYRIEPDNIVSNIPWLGIQAAIMGSEPRHIFLRDILDFYEDNQYALVPNNYNRTSTLFEEIAPEIYANIAFKYGFKRDKNGIQYLAENMVIFPSFYFAPDYTSSTYESYAVHCCSGEWRKSKKSLLAKIKNNNMVRRMFGLPLIDNSLDFYDKFVLFDKYLNNVYR